MFCDNFVSRVSLLHFLGGREKESKEEDDRANEEDDTVYSLKTGQTRFSYSSKQATSIQCNNCLFQTCHKLDYPTLKGAYMSDKKQRNRKLKNPVIFLVVT